MTGFISLFFIPAIVIGIANAFDYCNMESCYGELHTMCNFPTDEPGQNCGRMDFNKLTLDEKKELLIAHNEFRSTVASGNEARGSPGPQPAGIIPDLIARSRFKNGAFSDRVYPHLIEEWDDDLELVAQRLANQCTFQHDSCRNTEKYQAGQNLWISWASDSYSSSLRSAVQSWYDEVKDFSNYDVQKYKFSASTGHYSQLVWGETTHVGCGIAKFRTNWYSTLLVCNYGPAGNFINSPVYQTL